MPEVAANKYRAAIAVLQGGRDILVENLADQILDQGEELVEGGYLFNELLETQGTRLHFLCLLVSQLEQSAEMLEETEAFEEAPLPPPAAKPPTKKRAKAKSKKLEQQAAKQQEPTDEG